MISMNDNERPIFAGALIHLMERDGSAREDVLDVVDKAYQLVERLRECRDRLAKTEYAYRQDGETYPAGNERKLRILQAAIGMGRDPSALDDAPDPFKGHNDA